MPADATVTVELTLLPPVGAAPGDYPFVVAVEARSPGAAPATTLAEVVLRVDGVSDLVLSVEPADSRTVRRRAIQVVLANTGEQPVRVRLDALGDADLAVELNADDVDLDPHQTIRIPGQVRALRPRVVGSTRRSPFHVVATGARAPQRFDGSVALRPLLTSTVLKAVAITMVSLLWIGAVLAALPLVSQVVADRSQEQATKPSDESTVVVRTAGPAVGPTAGHRRRRPAAAPGTGGSRRPRRRAGHGVGARGGAGAGGARVGVRTRRDRDAVGDGLGPRPTAGRARGAASPGRDAARRPPASRHRRPARARSWAPRSRSS